MSLRWGGGDGGWGWGFLISFVLSTGCGLKAVAYRSYLALCKSQPIKYQRTIAGVKRKGKKSRKKEIGRKRNALPQGRISYHELISYPSTAYATCNTLSEINSYTSAEIH